MVQKRVINFIMCIPFVLSGMLSTYMRRMSNNNLEIRIAGPYWRLQLDVQGVKWILFKWNTISHSYLGKKRYGVQNISKEEWSANSPYINLSEFFCSVGEHVLASN